jgi:predicted nucleic acid-binding protein
MDETYGWDVAATEGITTRGTAYIVVLLATEGAIDVADARTIIDGMIDGGWYCVPDVYAKVVRKLDSISE